MSEERRPVAGADAENKTNIAALYAKLLDKKDGHSLGEYLFSQELKPQPIEVEGKTYAVELRFKRFYEPYSMHLDDVSMTPYEGTTRAHDYRSRLRLVDTATGHVRPLTLWMNHPARYHARLSIKAVMTRRERRKSRCCRS